VIWVLFIVVAVLVTGAFAALLAGRIGYDPMAAPTTTARDSRLPEGFHARDVTAVRFDTALRGYRMDQVDVVLAQLRDRIAELEGEPGAPRPQDVPAADLER
jgi:DivIVA domain-containing protein